MKAGIPHEDAPGVYDALPFLVANTRNVMVTILPQTSRLLTRRG